MIINYENQVLINIPISHKQHTFDVLTLYPGCMSGYLVDFTDYKMLRRMLLFSVLCVHQRHRHISDGQYRRTPESLHYSTPNEITKNNTPQKCC